jgi:hypothetical protein
LEEAQDKMFNEKRCLENLKRIASEYAHDENLKNLSLEELRSSYIQLAGNLYYLSVSNRLKYKSMLWNIDHLKPEIRSKFQAQLFKTWHSIYIKSIQTDQIKDRPNSKKKASSSLTTVEKHPETDAQQHPSGLALHKLNESENQKTAAFGEEPDLSREEKPAKRQSRIPASMASARQYENDWFDKLLDFFAAIVGGLSGMTGR